MGKLTFFVARHVADRIRNEPRNLGVIVTDGEHLAARFVGEVSSSGKLDLRQVAKNIDDRALYADWHRAWRSMIEDDTASTGEETTVEERIAALVETSTPSFLVQPSGDWYVDADELAAGDVHRWTDEIYRRIVDDAAEPLSDVVTESVALEAPRAVAQRPGSLADRIAEVFEALGILEVRDDARVPPSVAHPVKTDQSVQGLNPTPHLAKFVQVNGQRYVMEQVDFDVRDPEVARQRAAYAGYLLNDIYQADDHTVPIAVLNRVASRGKRGKALAAAQDYGEAALHQFADLQLVHWDNDVERKDFLEERAAVARGERH
jgi:hypothetical protein